MLERKIVSDLLLKIGELAKQTGSPVETIRYYEREGLIPTPNRTQGNYRIYGLPHIEQLQFVLRCRSLDMSLEEIRKLLTFRQSPEQNCREVNELLDRHIKHVSTRVSELQSLEDELKNLRKLCTKTQTAQECQILHGLSVPKVSKAKKILTHGRGSH